MRPIPARYMPSTAKVRVPLETEDGHQAFAEPVTIGRVRYDMAAGIKATEYQLQDGTTGLLFVDAVTSVGAFEIPAGSLVSVDGGPETCAVRCSTFRDRMERVHHWEVELR